MLELKGDISDYYDQLLKLLHDRSFRYSDTPKYNLAYKDELSNFYVDSKITTLSPDGLVLLGTILSKELAKIQAKIHGIGGLTFGADPISIATATISSLCGNRLYAFSIKKEQKNHGLAKWIEGDYHKGDNVVIVDDVVTTGRSTSFAIEKARDAGLNVIKVFVLVDREEENGLQKIKDLGVDVESIYTIQDLMRIHYNDSPKSEADNREWALSG